MPESLSGAGPVIEKHVLPLSDLDALGAGRLRPGLARRILTAERSRRMLMLRAVVEAAHERGAGTTGPLRPLSDAVSLLVRVERIGPGVVTDLLLHPGTGVWAVRMLERLRTDDVAQGERRPAAGLPLWEELGHLHALAGAAALRAGVAGTVRLAVREGSVALPTLGRVRLPAAASPAGTAVLRIPGAGETSPATLSAAGTEVRLPSDLTEATAVWQPSRTAAWRPTEGVGTLVLEDLDPYRDFRARDLLPPALTRPRAEQWRGLVREAGDLLRERHPRTAALLGFASRALVPLPPAPRFRNASASFSEAFGSALISQPRDARELAVTMVHEGRHSVLNALLHQVALCGDTTGDGAALLLHAPWRGDPRPPSGLLHGIYAFAGVADFWRVERSTLAGPEAALAHFEFAVWREAVVRAVETLRSHDVLTPLGRRFLDRLAEESAAWTADPVPAAPAALARSELADLRAVWRARHTVPDHDDVVTLAKGYLSGTDPAGMPAVSAQPRAATGVSMPHPRGELRRLFLLDPAALARHAHGPVYGAGRHTPSVEADVHLVSGAYGLAARGYRAVLAPAAGSPADPDPAAWAGLGLALAGMDGTGGAAAAAALMQRPEVVNAVWRSVREQDGPASDPGAVADWIGRIPDMLYGASD